jgi:hypothetical protein
VLPIAIAIVGLTVYFFGKPVSDINVKDKVEQTV